LVINSQNIHMSESYRERYPDLPPGNYVQLSIQDTGTGIDEDTMKHLYEPFFTTKKDGKVKGTGLGLATVYGIITNHSGIINVFSELNQGTTFLLNFPQGKIENSSQKAQDNHFLEKDEEANPKTEKCVLIVEDEEILRKMTKRILEKLGYSVIQAENGLRGVETYQEHHKKIDLVILDMKMPVMGGKEAYIRMKETNPHVKVLLSTGYGKNEEAQNLLNLGIDGLIAKPYQIDALSRILKDILILEK